MPEDDEIVDSLDEATEVIPFTYSITSYGADYPVDSIVKRVSSDDIIVPTFEHYEQLSNDLDAFQREYVWPRAKADRFIESLLLGLPVPGIFLVKEPSGRFLVLDGHQRLFTLRAFCDGIIQGKEYRLQGVQKRFEDKTYRELDVEDRRRIDDSIIHATVVRQDQPSEDWSSIYVIFERLNTGGISLQPQEIRMALYHGEFALLLRKLNEDKNWRRLLGVPSKRLKDIELTLRFFALLYHHSNYRSPMKDFLNRYMAANRNLEKQSAEELEKVFTRTTATIFDAMGPQAFKPTRGTNAALVDSLMVGIGTAVLSNKALDNTLVASGREALLQDPEFQAAIKTGTSQEPKVSLRIERSIGAFSK
jgi:uncharacterized protein DUF262